MYYGVLFIGNVIMVVIGKEGIGMECVPTQGKYQNQDQDQDRPLLPGLALKGDIGVSTLLNFFCVIFIFIFLSPQFSHVPNTQYYFLNQPCSYKNIFLFSF